MPQPGGFCAARSAEWPLIGRGEELAAVEQSLASRGAQAVVLGQHHGLKVFRFA